MTAIIDYGVGNLFSLEASFRKIGEEIKITKNPEDLKSADRIVLPGVGAFCDAAKKLNNSGMVPCLFEEIENGKPILGICLGMQLLFQKSYEYGEYDGLGLIKGEIRPISEMPGFDESILKVPHMGWNFLHFKNGKHPLFRYVNEGDYVYFVHSYCGASCAESTIAVTEYGCETVAAVAEKNVMGCQFHPEKSSDTGLAILRSFCEMKVGFCT